MSPYRLLPLLALVCLMASPARIRGDELPSDAAKRIKEFEAEAQAIQKKADAEIKSCQEKLLEDLQTLQEHYTKAGKLDQAVAIRGRIRQLKAELENASNLLVNGSFEEGPEPNFNGWITLEQGSTAIKGWEVTQGTIDHSTFWQHADGKRSLDLNGNTSGSISQSFKTRKGQKFRVTFWMAGNPDAEPSEKKLRVSAAGKSAEFVFDATGKNRKEMGWVSKSWEFVAGADQTTLEFASLMEGNAGPALDNVSVLAVNQ